VDRRQVRPWRAGDGRKQAAEKHLGALRLDGEHARAGHRWIPRQHRLAWDVEGSRQRPALAGQRREVAAEIQRGANPFQSVDLGECTADIERPRGASTGGVVTQQLPPLAVDHEQPADEPPAGPVADDRVPLGTGQSRIGQRQLSRSRIEGRHRSDDVAASCDPLEGSTEVHARPDLHGRRRRSAVDDPRKRRDVIGQRLRDGQRWRHAHEGDDEHWQTPANTTEHRLSNRR